MSVKSAVFRSFLHLLFGDLSVFHFLLSLCEKVLLIPSMSASNVTLWRIEILRCWINRDHNLGNPIVGVVAPIFEFVGHPLRAIHKSVCGDL